MNARDNEFAAMSTDELEERRNEVMSELADIKAQIEGAKHKAFQDGIYADADWLTRAKHALRYRGIEHQKLNVEIARRKKDERLKRASSFSESFVESARQMLPVELFTQILASAMEKSK